MEVVEDPNMDDIQAFFRAVNGLFEQSKISKGSGSEPWQFLLADQLWTGTGDDMQFAFELFCKLDYQWFYRYLRAKLGREVVDAVSEALGSEKFTEYCLAISTNQLTSNGDFPGIPIPYKFVHALEALASARYKYLRELRKMRAYTKSGNVCRTASNRLCLAPLTAEEGDVVTFIEGYSYPLLMRKCCKDSVYRHVGELYFQDESVREDPGPESTVEFKRIYIV